VPAAGALHIVQSCLQRRLLQTPHAHSFTQQPHSSKQPRSLAIAQGTTLHSFDCGMSLHDTGMHELSQMQISPYMTLASAAAHSITLTLAPTLTLTLNLFLP